MEFSQRYSQGDLVRLIQGGLPGWKKGEILTVLKDSHEQNIFVWCSSPGVQSRALRKIDVEPVLPIPEPQPEDKNHMKTYSVGDEVQLLQDYAKLKKDQVLAIHEDNNIGYVYAYIKQFPGIMYYINKLNLKPIKNETKTQSEDNSMHISHLISKQIIEIDTPKQTETIPDIVLTKPSSRKIRRVKMEYKTISPVNRTSSGLDVCFNAMASEGWTLKTVSGCYFIFQRPKRINSAKTEETSIPQEEKPTNQHIDKITEVSYSIQNRVKKEKITLKDFESVQLELHQLFDSCKSLQKELTDIVNNISSLNVEVCLEEISAIKSDSTSLLIPLLFKRIRSELGLSIEEFGKLLRARCPLRRSWDSGFLSIMERYADRKETGVLISDEAQTMLAVYREQKQKNSQIA